MWNGVVDVNIEPTRLDELMWQISVVSTIATVLLGGLAWWNGHKATVIAEESIRREEDRIAAERQAQIDEARKETALSMVQALIAYSTFSNTSARYWVGGTSGLVENPRFATARQDAENAESTALALISLFETTPQSSSLRKWMSHASLHVYCASGAERFPTKAAELMLDRYLSSIGAWGSGGLTTAQLLLVHHPGPISSEDENEWCSGGASA